MANDPLWLWLLRRAVAASAPIKVARQLGVSRSSICMVLSGTYPGTAEKLRSRALEVLGETLQCPHTKSDVTVADCYQIGGSAKPPINRPLEIPHWHACQACPHSVKRKGDVGEKKV